MSISTHGPGLWYATRAAGLVTLILLTANVVMGVLINARLSGRDGRASSPSGCTGTWDC
jgi:hypothetical protein